MIVDFYVSFRLAKKKDTNHTFFCLYNIVAVMVQTLHWF